MFKQSGGISLQSVVLTEDLRCD